MKHRVWFLVAAAMTLATAAPAATSATEADVLVESEHAFAAMAKAQGIRAAFVEWLAPTGVIFRPGPVLGRKSYESRPAGPGRLAWDPDHAVMSASGDMGWTTGPWTFRTDSSQIEPVAYGQFVTVWRKQADGSWRAAIDAGISHGPAPSVVTQRVMRTLGPANSGSSRPLAKRKSLWQADAEFVKLARAQGPGAALLAFAASDAVVLREGSQPWIGATGRDSVTAREPLVNMMSTAQFMSRAGDLGYTYGTYSVPGEAEIGSGHYMHIWERDTARVWKLALQVVLPMPPKP
ncbi:MAG: nuclear transport factor 2 family protein [Candidatus Eisenbacteria bacterium]